MTLITLLSFKALMTRKKTKKSTANQKEATKWLLTHLYQYSGNCGRSNSFDPVVPSGVRGGPHSVKTTGLPSIHLHLEEFRYEEGSKYINSTLTKNISYPY